MSQFDYRYLDIDLNLERDVWVRAVDILPGNKAALHHVLVSLNYPEGFTPPMKQRARWIDGTLAGYAPGAEAEVFPEGTGRFIPAGSTARFQLHYTATGKPEVDETKLGLYLSEGTPEREYLITGPVNSDFVIPPHARAFTASAE